VDDVTAQAMAALLGSVQTRLLIAAAVAPPFVSNAATRIQQLHLAKENAEKVIDEELVACLRVADRLIELSKQYPPSS
jgi:hypothetical protein